MLTPRKRVVFTLLNGLLLVSGLLEMGGMLFVFGFIGGLRVKENGHRGGRLGPLFEFVHGGTMDSHVYVLLAGSIVLGVLAIKNILSTLVQFALNRFLMKLNQHVSESLLEGVLVAPFEKVNQEGASGLSGKIAKIFEVFSASFTSIAQVLADGTMVLMVLLLLLFIDPGLTIGAGLLFGCIGVIMYQMMQRTLVGMGRIEVQARKQSGAYLSDGIRGLAEVRLRDARPFVQRGYARALQATALQRRRMSALERLPRAVNEMSLTAMIVGSVYYLTHTGGSIEAALPTLGIFCFAGLKMTGALTRINKSFQRLRRTSEEFESYYEAILMMAPETFGKGRRTAENDYLHQERPFSAHQEGRLREKITVSKVAFSYSGDVPVLKDVTLEIPRGSFASFCGPSGGGKSTLVLIILGLLKPQRGVVRCDDWDISEHPRAWHQNIGYVGQEMYIARRTIRENVAFGEEEEFIDDEKVWAALKLASAYGFVKKLPKMLRYRLSEGGTNLSGGQRQRIIIARALYRDPEIVVFDEATAALDNRTERSISRAIRRIAGAKTVICIAHRLSTIRDSDVIHVVDKGSVSASGSYEELLEKSPTFRELASKADQPSKSVSE